MATSNAEWIRHPGAYIKEEMEERGWLQRDLAFILGAPEPAINMILSGKRAISPDMAKALGEAFDVPAEFFANLQQAYDMAQARNPYAGVVERSRMQSVFPVREMIQRQWILTADATMLETQLARFFDSRNADEIPYMPHVAKKGKYEERDIKPAQLAWLFRVRQIARSISVPVYSETALRSAIKDFEKLLHAPQETRHVPKVLSDCGVKFILVEKLTNADIDGVCFWLDGSPVIGMSVTRDRIDNFWFVLRHECEHVLRGHGQEEEMIDVNVEAQVSTDVSAEERVANEAAENFCVPNAKFDSFMLRKHPFYAEKDVIAFARLMNRHPGLVVGRMRKRLDRWNYLTRHLVKIRQYVLPTSIADGWGQVFPVSV